MLFSIPLVQQLWFARATSRQYITALRVALLVGSVLFAINHGEALITGTMDRVHWVSGMLTYCVPFCVSLHGQCQTTAGFETPNLR